MTSLARLAASASLAALACQSPPAQPAKDIPVVARPYDPADARPGAEKEGDPGDDEVVRPVYNEKVDDNPQARALCDALYALPDQRTNTCCQRGDRPSTQAVQFADQCTHNLSAALASGGVQLLADRVDACVAAVRANHDGCEWVGPWGAPHPPACAGVLAGQLAADAACRSNLECAPGLRCDGVGPTDPGVCRPPAADGSQCDTAVDPLATFLRIDVAAEHPPCTGHCKRRRCDPHVALGGACTGQSECAPGLHCDGEACREGATVAVGQPCSGGGCVDGARCHKNTCLVRAASGAACTTDQECRGGCLDGRCGPRCTLPALMTPKRP